MSAGRNCCSEGVFPGQLHWLAHIMNLGGPDTSAERSVAAAMSLTVNNQTGLTWQSVPTLTKRTSLSDSTVRRAIKGLVHSGWIAVAEERIGESTKYLARVPDSVTHDMADPSDPFAHGAEGKLLRPVWAPLTPITVNTPPVHGEDPGYSERTPRPVTTNTKHQTNTERNPEQPQLAGSARDIDGITEAVMVDAGKYEEVYAKNPDNFDAYVAPIRDRIKGRVEAAIGDWPDETDGQIIERVVKAENATKRARRTPSEFDPDFINGANWAETKTATVTEIRLVVGPGDPNFENAVDDAIRKTGSFAGHDGDSFAAQSARNGIRAEASKRLDKMLNNHGGDLEAASKALIAAGPILTLEILKPLKKVI